MTTAKWNTVVNTLAKTMGPEAQSPKSAAFVIQAAVLLTKGNPITLNQVRAKLGFSHVEAQEVFSFLNDYNEIELDGDGQIVGVAGLTLNQTIHQFITENKTLYTWCAIDALFFPLVLGKTAQIVSKCPVSGAEIQIIVTPEGISHSKPMEAVLSIMIPGTSAESSGVCDSQSCGPEESALFGPGGAFCGNVHFFISEGTASQWVAVHPDVILLSVQDAYKLAVEVWARPLIEHAG